MTDIRDASAHTDGFEPRPGVLPFGISPDDIPYGGDRYDEPDRFEELDDAYDEVPLAPLALPPGQVAALVAAIERGLRERGCDTTLRAAQAWAVREEISWPSLRTALEDRGGFCDCEVLLNIVEPPG